jgi:hypothetical protein
VGDPELKTSPVPPDLKHGWEGNADVKWDLFNSTDYFEHNYQRLHKQDESIIHIVADHFERRAGAQWRERAIDVGSGANLYPALTMLPFAAEVILYERAFTNRQWLVSQLSQPAPSWQQDFWPAISEGRAEYTGISNPIELLGRRAKVVKGNVFDLRPNQFGLGTMFFVAESITKRDDEFERATRLFVGSLVSKAPFAAAFMRNSSGYIVGGESFPACSIDEEDVERCLADLAAIDDIQVVEGNELREGYRGMIVATGRKR